MMDDFQLQLVDDALGETESSQNLPWASYVFLRCHLQLLKIYCELSKNRSQL